MRVIVTGGTGAVGSYAVPALIDAGHTVSAIARSATKADILRDQGAAPVRVSLFDRLGLASAFANNDAVVNLASALPSTTAFIRYSAWKECERVRTEGSHVSARAISISNARIQRGAQASCASADRSTRV